MLFFKNLTVLHISVVYHNFICDNKWLLDRHKLDDSILTPDSSKIWELTKIITKNNYKTVNNYSWHKASKERLNMDIVLLVKINIKKVNNPLFIKAC